ncbi:uncharacterized protein LOC128192304 [Crassostrea angulata]|uniref:uncharacterized protein LOC128192304 n=1 Tax=Magallana angulata TaxID=2784310 RepID=UPI0022B1A149|nr:uncharacterized protein LOC128192304 [Crassostrea angulata]
MEKITRFFEFLTKPFQFCFKYLGFRKRGEKVLAHGLLFSVMEAHNKRLESLNNFQISNKIDWRMDYFGGLLKEEKVSLIPLIVYFAEQNERALCINISSRGLPVCQETAT